MSLSDHTLGSGRRTASGIAVEDHAMAAGTRKEVWILQRNPTPKQAPQNENTARLTKALSAHGIVALPIDPYVVDQTRGPEHLRVRRRRVA
ncbi:MAG: hypothetical protein AAFP23_10390, partial [Pseudomonadota bacterium]